MYDVPETVVHTSPQLIVLQIPVHPFVLSSIRNGYPDALNELVHDTVREPAVIVPLGVSPIGAEMGAHIGVGVRVGVFVGGIGVGVLVGVLVGVFVGRALTSEKL